MVPIGGIIQWSGAIVDIPINFALCDGDNGTPDLRDKFIVGAGSAYGVGQTGGALTHFHSGGGSVSVAGAGPSNAWDIQTDSDTSSSLPPFYALASIMRIT